MHRGGNVCWKHRQDLKILSYLPPPYWPLCGALPPEAPLLPGGLVPTAPSSPLIMPFYTWSGTCFSPLSETFFLCIVALSVAEGGRPFIVYQSAFPDKWCIQWKVLNFPFSGKHQASISLLETIFLTQKPTMEDTQQCFWTHFTTKEQDHIRPEAHKLVWGYSGRYFENPVEIDCDFLRLFQKGIFICMKAGRPLKSITRF